MQIKETFNSKEELFVIGGATIYKMLMPYTKKMYITKIDEEFEADTYFPVIDEKEWKVENREKGKKDEVSGYIEDLLQFASRMGCYIPGSYDILI